MSELTSKERVSNEYLQNTQQEISRANALDSQLISTAFLQMLLTEIIERRTSAEPCARQTASFWRDDALENAALICERYEATDAALNIRAMKGATTPPCELPAVLFDGYAVWQELKTNNPYVTADDVSHVLDAVVRLIRAAPTKSGDAA